MKNTNQEKATAVSKEDKIIEYIRQNGSISSQKAADIGGVISQRLELENCLIR